MTHTTDSIRLTESELRNIISNSLKSVLNEKTNAYTRSLKNAAYNVEDYGQWTPAQNELLGALHKFVNLTRQYKSLIPCFVAQFSDNNQVVEILVNGIEYAIEKAKDEAESGRRSKSHTGIPELEYNRVHHQVLNPGVFDERHYYK